MSECETGIVSWWLIQETALLCPLSSGKIRVAFSQCKWIFTLPYDRSLRIITGCGRSKCSAPFTLSERGRESENFLTCFAFLFFILFRFHFHFHSV